MKNITLFLLMTISLSGMGQNMVRHFTMNRINNAPGTDFYEEKVAGSVLQIPGVNVFPLNLRGVRDTVGDQSIFFEGNMRLTSFTNIDNRNWTGAAFSLWVRNCVDGIIINLPFGGYGVFATPSGRIAAQFRGSSSGALTTVNPVNDGMWHHIFAQNDGSTTTIYLDGVLNASRAENLFIPTSLSNDAKFRVGADRFNNNRLDGQVDEIKVFDGIFSQVQIDSIYQMDRSNSLLYKELQYNFDGNFLDSSLNQNHLQYNNGNRFSFTSGNTNMIADSALNLSGVNGTMRTRDLLPNINWSGLAISVWVKNLRDGFLIQAPGVGYGLHADATGNILAFFDGSSSASLSTTSNAATLDTNWHHLVVQNDGDSSYIFIDGVLHNQQREQFFAPSQITTTQHLYFASSVQNPIASPSFGNYVDGEVDDLNLFSRALTAIEVNELFQFGIITRKEEQLNIKFKDFVCYPNPTEDFLNLPEAVHNADHIRIFDTNGKVVLEATASNRLNVSGLKSGLYFVYLNQRSELFRSKFLKK